MVGGVCSDCSEGQPGPGLRAADARELAIAHRARLGHYSDTNPCTLHIMVLIPMDSLPMVEIIY